MEEKEFDEVKPKYDEVEKKPKEIKTISYFDGKFMEYIGYKILAFLITVVTLTIAKPWADKLILDYKINHTLYNGKRLKFEGKGSSLFVQRFKWTFFTIITLGIYSFWIPIKKEKWITSNIHFEDEEFKAGESYFDGKLIGLIGVNILTYILTICSFGILLPFALCYKQKWIAKHTIINCKKIMFDGTAISLIGHYILWWLLTCITFGIYGIWVQIKLYSWQVKNTHIKLKDETYKKQSALPAIIGIAIAILFITGLVILIPKTNIPKIISGEKEISDIFEFNNEKEETSINFDVQGIVENEQACPSGFEYDSINNYCVTLYEETDKKTCDKLGGEFNKNTKSCGVILLKPSTTVNDISCVNDWNSNDTYKKCYNHIPVSSIEECKNKNAIGYYYSIHGELWCTTTVSNEDLITQTNNSNNQSNKINNTPTNNTKKSKCNSGYIYDNLSNECYSLNEYVEPTANCSNPDAACEAICPNGYKISWDADNGFNGECYKVAKPNY